ncbi:hypothetical protein TNCV_4004911 [Trichonephila clavipes]|nr:hypothetical protein TNCV_4004911 [Trichonephila clavipes]
MVRTVTLVVGPALKPAAICTSATLNDSPQSSLASFLNVLFRPQRCHRFDALSNSRYSRYTREMVVRENPILSLPRRCYVPSLVCRL